MKWNGDCYRAKYHELRRGEDCGRYNAETRCLELVAGADIAAGAEVLLNYGPLQSWEQLLSPRSRAIAGSLRQFLARII